VCNGCCCWLPASPQGTPYACPGGGVEICGDEPCCTGNGR
jgi:hypothetical protein